MGQTVRMTHISEGQAERVESAPAPAHLGSPPGSAVKLVMSVRKPALLAMIMKVRRTVGAWHASFAEASRFTRVLSRPCPLLFPFFSRHFPLTTQLIGRFVRGPNRAFSREENGSPSGARPQSARAHADADEYPRSFLAQQSVCPSLLSHNYSDLT